MRLDPIITRRFEELTVKAEAVSNSKYPDEHKEIHNRVSSPLFKAWATNALSLTEKTFGRESIQFTNLLSHYDNFTGWEFQFEECRAIFEAAREDYEGGYLFTIRSLVKAEVLSDAFEQAKELLRNGYKDPACVLSRVGLEVSLKELCDKNGIIHTSLNRMNEDLCKAGVYNMAKQKQLTAWTEIGNKAAHGQWDQYTDKDAQAMLNGVEALVADIL